MMLTATVQVAPAARVVAPVRRISLLPVAGAPNAPAPVRPSTVPPQVVLVVALASVMAPGVVGNRSVKAMVLMTPGLAAGLVMVKVSALLAPALIGLVPNSLLMVGGV